MFDMCRTYEIGEGNTCSGTMVIQAYARRGSLLGWDLDRERCRRDDPRRHDHHVRRLLGLV